MLRIGMSPFDIVPNFLSAGDTPYSLSLLMPEKNLAWMIPSVRT